MAIHSETFSGNVYLFIPGSLNPSSSINTITRHAPPCDLFADSFIAIMKTRFNTEISSEVHSSIARYYLGIYSLACYDDLELNDNEALFQDSRIFLSLDHRTKLCAITIILHDTILPASQLLDRLSRDKLLIKEKNERFLLKDYLEEKLGLLTTSAAAKACLSTRENIDANIIPYYLANETFDSTDMSAKLSSPEIYEQMHTNVAQYESSEIYVGRRSVLRIDKRPSKSKQPELKSDGAFLFILEALIIKEASVLRTNEKVLRSIGNSELLVLENMDLLTKEFATTMPFWNTNIFNYITAQQLANRINDAFGINQRFEQYQKNQSFLQHKINIRRGITQNSENKVLYLIAIILFVFELFPYSQSIFQRILEGKWYSALEISYTTGGVVSTGLLAFIIISLIKRKKSK